MTTLINWHMKNDPTYFQLAFTDQAVNPSENQFSVSKDFIQNNVSHLCLQEMIKQLLAAEGCISYLLADQSIIEGYMKATKKQYYKLHAPDIGIVVESVIEKLFAARFATLLKEEVCITDTIQIFVFRHGLFKFTTAKYGLEIWNKNNWTANGADDVLAEMSLDGTTDADAEVQVHIEVEAGAKADKTNA